MADDYVQVPPNSTGAKIDQERVLVGANQVMRQRMVQSDPTDAAGHARVKNAPPAAGDYGVVTRAAPSGLQEAVINVASAGDHNVIAAVTGQVITIWRLLLWSNGDNQLSIRDGATPLMGAMDLAQGAEVLLPKDADPWFTLGVNSPFNLNTTQAAQLSGRVYYKQG